MESSHAASGFRTQYRKPTVCAMQKWNSETENLFRKVSIQLLVICESIRRGSETPWWFWGQSPMACLCMLNVVTPKCTKNFQE